MPSFSKLSVALLYLTLCAYAVPVPLANNIVTSIETRDDVTVGHLARRAIANPAPTAAEFVGFHGTNSATADLWEKSGSIVKPGSLNFDFISFSALRGLLGGSAGGSGADAELGPGLYVSDDITQTLFFANGNASKNKGTTAKICAIFAKNSNEWRALPKAIIPKTLFGNGNFEKARTAYLTGLATLLKKTFAPAGVIRFGFLSGSSSQMILPESLNSKFFAKCFDASLVGTNGQITANPAVPPLPAGVAPFTPAASYLGRDRQAQWNIQAGVDGLVKQSKNAANLAR